MREIILVDIKPFGNLAPLLDELNSKVTELEAEGYSGEVAKTLKVIVGYGFSDVKFWFDDMRDESDRVEIEMIVLCGLMLVIRLNNIAQKALNGIDMEPISVQLGDSPEVKEFFPDVKFI